MMEKKQIKFLKKLYKLYKKYNIAVGACGCCDSPFLVHLEHSGKAYSAIQHLKDNETKTVKPFDAMAGYIRKVPKPLKIPPPPLRDINVALNDVELVSKIQKRLDDLH